MSFLDQRPGGYSSRNNFVEPPSLLHRASSLLPNPVKSVLATSRKRVMRSVTALAEAYGRERRRNRRAGAIIALLRIAFSLPNLLLLMWVLTLWWGERSVFRMSVEECGWEKWEKWPENSVPSHVALIADPQLVDAHTYPGRPWPLSSLTVFYSDLYLYRTYSLLQQHLQPDATLFLGDLFDGGREWGTGKSVSPVPMFKNYGNNVWMKEYRRFAKIFIDRWKLGDKAPAAGRQERKLIASLPGNHDIGFGNGIQLPVLERFRTFFGDGNRLDIIGNHTFVSVDSVSLSAMDQPDPATGSSGSSGDGGSDMEKIWKPTEEFLNNMETLKGKAIKEELLLLNGEAEKFQSPHAVSDIESAPQPSQIAAPSTADFPNIVLSHVPFYREPATPCGPLREYYPPSSTDPLPEKDERNALRIAGGYQYQNVLTDVISRDVATKAGPLMQIYSGDDHDYCEVTHREFTGAPREVTVKSMSLAMGVRKPGFQMVSLWNPIDPKTGKQNDPSSSQTLQDHLCLLPDQITIFVQYGYVFVFTVLVLLVRALSFAFRASDTLDDPNEPILPLTNRYPNGHTASSTTSTSSSSPSGNDRRLGSRRNTLTSRTSSSPPTVQIIGASGADDTSRNFRRVDTVDKIRDAAYAARSSVSPERDIPVRGLRRSIFIFRSEFVSSLKRVCIWAFVWYLWLVWTW